MSQTTIASSGSAPSIAARKPLASGSRGAQARAHLGVEACEALARARRGRRAPGAAPASAAGAGGGVRLHEHVGRVVLGGVGGVHVDRHQVRRLGLLDQPWVIIAVEVGADGQHQVGLVPEGAHLGHVRGRLDEAGVAGRAAGRAPSR